MQALINTQQIYKHRLLQSWHILRFCTQSALLAVCFLLFSAQALAITYNFSNSGVSPALSGCSRTGAGTYTCTSAVTLTGNDSITISGTTPATITFNSNLTLQFLDESNSAKINSGGSAANLNLIVNGTLAIGKKVIIMANIQGGSVSDTGGDVVFGGSINTTTGAVRLDYRSAVAGSITTTSGAITLNDRDTVGGSVTSTSGGINFTNKSTISGNVSCTTCTFTLTGLSSTINGTTTVGTLNDSSSLSSPGTIYNNDITTLTGDAIVGYYATVNGNITAKSNIQIRNFADVAGDISSNNVNGNTLIDILDDATVNGNISATASGIFNTYVYVRERITVNGSITTFTPDLSEVRVYTTSTVNGDITSFGGDSSTVFIWGTVVGNVKSTATDVNDGNLYLYANSTVNGSVYVSSNIFNYGTVTGCAQTTDISSGQHVYLYSGSSTYATCSGTTTCSTNTSYVNKHSSITMPPICTFNVVPANFNCTVVSGASDTGRLFTQLVSTNFNVDVIALKSTGAVETGYVTSGTKNVTLEFVDGSGTTACASRAAISPAVSQTVTFASTDLGRKTVSNINISRAYRDLRCRVTDANQSPSVVGCSTDNFAVRPSGFTVTSSNTNADNAGANTTATPAIKAGASFNLSANAGVLGYDGTPIIDTSKIIAHAGAVQVGNVSGLFSAANTTTGIATGASFNYSEVGYFNFAANGVYDSSFTSVDAGAGDCVAGFTASGGKYSCSFGNTAASNYFGRFIPDHFSITAGANTEGCDSGNFTYYGQDGLSTTFSLKAENTSNQTTQNYIGDYAKLGLNSWANFNFTSQGSPYSPELSASATLPTGIWLSGAASVTAKHQISRLSAMVPLSTKCSDENNFCSFSGTRTVIYGLNGFYTSGTFTNGVSCSNSVFGDPLIGTVKACYIANLPSPSTITVFARPTDSDGVTMVSAPVSLPSLFRYGRLIMPNVYGSELLPLSTTIEAQYWNGNVYQRNQQDNCSVIPANTIAMGNYRKNLTACETQLSGAGTLNAGKTTATLAKPGAGNSGSVDLTINLNGASGSTCNSATSSSAGNANMPWFGNSNPSSQATFGLFKTPVIYMRENFFGP